MDLNQTWVIDATCKPAFVDEVKDHIPRSKVKLGQVENRLLQCMISHGQNFKLP